MCSRNSKKHSTEQECIPIGCVPPACWLYLPACTAPGGGGYLPGEYLPRGCTCLGGVPAQVGVPEQGVYLPRGWTCPGGVPAQGVDLPRGCTCPGGGTCLGGYLPGGCTCLGVPAQVLPPPPREQNS